MLEPSELKNRFEYHAPTGNKADNHAFIRNACGDLANFINTRVPDGREKSLAITHLEEVMFWANAAIARNPE